MNMKQSELKADPSVKTTEIVAQLKRLHEAGQGASHALPLAEEATVPPVATSLASTLAPLGDYDALQNRIAAVEAQLRAHKDRVTEFLEAPKVETRQRIATQATLSLQCPRGGQSGGRFVCRNHFDHSAALTIGIQDFVDAKGQPVEGVSLSLIGAEHPIAAGETRTLKCRVDLSACVGGLESPLEGAVDLSFEGASCMRLWVEVDVHD